MLRIFSFILLIWASPGGTALAQDTVLRLQTDKGWVPFRIELANTPDTRAQGLMFRQTLAPDAGMLFTYESERPIVMWMKNTPLSLDMIFFSKTGTVVGVAENTTPYSLDYIHSPALALAVLEVRGGTAKRLGIKRGAKADHPVFGQAGP